MPIVAVNMPEGKYCARSVSRNCYVYGWCQHVQNHSADKFKVIVDYNELIDSPYGKCNVYLRYIPHGVRNAKMDVNQVDYLIEDQ